MYRFTGSWLHKAIVRLCAGLLAILGIKLSAFTSSACSSCWGCIGISCSAELAPRRPIKTGNTLCCRFLLSLQPR